MSVNASLTTAAVGVLSLSLAVSAFAEGEADARFRGAGQTDPPRIANATCKPAGDGVAAVSFDLAWDHSWRATWEVPEAQHGGKGTLKLENWDAAWVFVKFRKPGADWAHATLATSAAEHQVPAEAKLDVGLSDDGQRGLGAFVYRLAPGGGKNDWKGVTLRWRYAADGVAKLDRTVVVAADGAAAAPRKGKAELQPGGTPGDRLDDATMKLIEAADASDGTQKATELRVIAIPMIYVPECAFWLGDGTTNGIAGQFTAGDTAAPFRVPGEQALTLGGANPENLGNSDGMFTSDDFNRVLTQSLPASFPKGFAAFYCMKRELTQGDWVAFLNSVNAERQAAMQKEMGSIAEIGTEGTGAAAKYVTAAPGSACSGMTWSAGMAYAGWAGLRPMSELEFEKACRGPLKPSPDEYAWGGAEPNSDGGRAAARASYWGVLNLSGGLWDMTVGVCHYNGRHYAGRHGVGALTGPDDWRVLGMAETGRGGEGSTPGSQWRTSYRETRLMPAWYRRAPCGFRFVRSAAAGQAPVALPDESTNAATWFNDALRISNLAVSPRDAKTATLKFDIAWEDSWRNTTNHDAAWVFFKSRTAGVTNWAHVKLAADPPSLGSSGVASKTLNPVGYGQENGTKLEFVVPDGPDGFTGVFLQRATAGAGPLSAKGVTVVCDAQSLNTENRTLNTSLHAFGLEMVYVAQGPFSLGSGGDERNRFYQYTDGSQNTRPYRVLDAGAIPTGPQAGRLWATGVLPDATDAGQIPSSFPNGYRAFYGMKFSIKQGQFAAFLAMQSAVRSDDHAGRAGNGPALVMSGTADAFGLTWWMGASFGAWAGLRPLTELEYEKACRGPREPRPNETVASYWGFRELNLGLVYGRFVSVATPAARAFAGTHGLGTTALPGDWPSAKAEGVMSRGSGCSLAPVSLRRPYVNDEDPARHNGRLPDPVFNGWRGGRTAPAPTAAVRAPPRAGCRLELDPLPDLRAADVGVFYLAGRCHNDTDQPLKAEVSTPLPEACFPDGPAARVLNAAPKAATSFKILTVLTRQTGRVSRRGQWLPIRIQAPGGDLLAEQTVHLPLLDPLAETPPVVGSLAGGKVSLLVTNTTDRPQALAFEMTPPPDVKLAETNQSVEIAAGAKAEVAFAMPGQVFATAGFRRIPYRVTVAKSGPQAGEVIAELRVESRWWVTQRQIQSGPAAGSEGPESTGNELDGLLEGVGLADSAAKKKEAKRDSDWTAPSDIFKTDKPSPAWRTLTHGASLWVSKFSPLPKKDTIVQAATRVISPADREAVIKVASESVGYTWVDSTLFASCDWGLGPRTAPFVGRVWLNGEVIYDSRPDVKAIRQNARLRKGANTLLVQCLANAQGADHLGNIFVLFFDARTGARMTDLELDMEKR